MGLATGGDHAPAVATGRHRRVLLEARAHPARDLAARRRGPTATVPTGPPRAPRRAACAGRAAPGNSRRACCSVSCSGDPPDGRMRQTSISIGRLRVRGRSRSTGRLATRPDSGCAATPLQARGSGGRRRRCGRRRTADRRPRLLKYTRRVPSGDQAGAVASSLRNGRGVPPVSGMSICRHRTGPDRD